MERDFLLYNTLTRKKEKFEPLVPGHLGLYVCGPTVYGDPHLGHARPAVIFDVLVRLFRHLGYKVRYVRNITDVGHLQGDADQGEDKIARKARLENLEPMEVAHYYTLRYHKAMEQLGTLPPGIEPNASGHIMEQIALVRQILDAGFAYESNGSVYFDVSAYNKKYHYGALSGRVLDDLQAGSRTLDGQDDKRSPYDFALWKKAAPEHLMHWPSPWSEGFPGWHLECSVMSAKYLGQVFDIHGGGMDLMFPHHECEMAQNTVSRGPGAVRYWMHNNLITINGQKMGKSLGNFITLDALFKGDHPKLERAYSPMTVRFFVLQAHYRGTLDFSNEALQAAEKGLKRMTEAQKVLEKLPVAPDAAASGIPARITEDVYKALCDDLNTPIALAHLFDLVKWINTAADAGTPVAATDKAAARVLYAEIVGHVLGLQDNNEGADADNDKAAISGLMDLVLDLRAKAKTAKDWATSDQIRDKLKALGFTVKDGKEGAAWSRD